MPTRIATGIDKNSVSGVDPDPTSKPRSYMRRRESEKRREKVRKRAKADAQSQLEFNRALVLLVAIVFRYPLVRTAIEDNRS